MNISPGFHITCVEIFRKLKARNKNGFGSHFHEDEVTSNLRKKMTESEPFLQYFNYDVSGKVFFSIALIHWVKFWFVPFVSQNTIVYITHHVSYMISTG